MRSHWLVMWVALLSPAGNAIQESSERPDAPLISALEEAIPRIMSRYSTPGLNIALARRGEVVWEAGFGFADLAKGIRTTPATVFHSGSMGKTYTATAVMQLVEQGALDLHSPIADFLEDVEARNPLGDREITVYDLLTHRSGLTGNAAGCRFVAPPPLAEHIRQGYLGGPFKSYGGTLLPRFSAKVGETFQYSNFGMATLGYLVEVTNPDELSFSEYVQQHIMDPLGMTSSQFPAVQDAAHVDAEIFARFSTGYARFGRVYLPTPTIYFADYPAGTVVSTPGDHIRLLLAYLGDGEYNGERILAAETVQQMLTPQADPFLGLVWFLNDVGKSSFNFSHGGAHMYGWNHSFVAFPEQDFAVVVATNQWDMVPGRSYEAIEVANFVSAFLLKPVAPASDTAAKVPSIGRPAPRESEGESSFAWKYSYVMGLIMVDRLLGSLGIEDPLTPEMIRAMADGAMLREDVEDARRVWDAYGFQAGVQDMLAVDMTLEAIREFLQSDKMRVTPQELQEIGRAMGSEGAPLFGAIQ